MQLIVCWYIVTRISPTDFFFQSKFVRNF